MDLKRIVILSYEEIIERIRARYSRANKSEISRLQTIYNIATSSTQSVEELSDVLRGLHSFYWKLIEIEFNRSNVEEALRCVTRARRLSKKFWEKYRYLILASTSRESRKVLREGRGRILSLYKRCRRHLLLLKNLIVYLQRLPSINPEEPILIVAGPPNVGKSTFVRSISTGKPEIANYPFTTKHITVGHRDYGRFKLQVIDTPGLLDRPVEEMNIIERRAIAALGELKGIILFLIDPSDQSHMDINRQFRIIENIVEVLADKPLFIGINKVDIASKERIEEALMKAEELKAKGIALNIYKLSALNREDASNVVDDIVSKCKL
ncbi:MAG: GTPase [Acidilobaceae archaeon]